MSARLASLVFALLACLPAQAARVVAVTVDGVVHPVTVEMIGHAIDQARQPDASLILRLNTPGGLMDAMRESHRKDRRLAGTGAALVAPSGGRAASAGFFLLEACDIAAMAPGTNTGAAHPGALRRPDGSGHEAEGGERRGGAMLRSIVSKRGRNSALAEKAVFESRSFTDKEALEDNVSSTWWRAMRPTC